MGRALLTALLLASVALVAWSAGHAAAAVNISGNWNFTLQHPDIVGTIACTATIGQGGTDLSASMACDQLGSGTLTGTIDVDAGNFTLSGSLANPMTFVGQAAQDGNSASGYWVVSPVPGSGTFSGGRVGGDAGVGGLAALANVPGDDDDDGGGWGGGLPSGLLALFTAVAGVAALSALTVVWRKTSV